MPTKYHTRCTDPKNGFAIPDNFCYAMHRVWILANIFLHEIWVDLDEILHNPYFTYTTRAKNNPWSRKVENNKIV